MKVERHRQGESRLHKSRDKQKLTATQRHTRYRAGNCETGTLANESLQPASEQSQVKPELCDFRFDMQVVTGEPQQTQAAYEWLSASFQQRCADSRDDQHSQERKLE